MTRHGACTIATETALPCATAESNWSRPPLETDGHNSNANSALIHP